MNPYAGDADRLSDLPRPARRPFARTRLASPRVGVAAVLAACVFSVFLAWPTCPPPRVLIRAGRPGDMPLYASEVERVRNGESYYAAAAQELRNWGYPTRPFLTWRLPTLTYILAALPSERWAWIILVALVLATVLSWFLLMLRDAGPLTAIATGALAFGGLVVGTAASGVYCHEVWGGVLIALSLAVYGLGFPWLAIVFGVCAALIRELAIPYLGIMGTFAILARRRRESTGWLAAMGVVALALAVHAYLVHAQPSVEVRSGSWLALGGACFVRSTLQWHLIAMTIPSTRLLAPVVSLSLLGAAAWPGPLGTRLCAILLGYVGAFLFFGRADNNYWGFIFSPVLYLGLAMLPRFAKDFLTNWRSTTRTWSGGVRRSGETA